MRFPLLVTCEGVRTWPLWCRCRLQVALQGVRQVVSETWWGVTAFPRMSLHPGRGDRPILDVVWSRDTRQEI